MLMKTIRGLHFSCSITFLLLGTVSIGYGMNGMNIERNPSSEDECVLASNSNSFSSYSSDDNPEAEEISDRSDKLERIKIFLEKIADDANKQKYGICRECITKNQQMHLGCMYDNECGCKKSCNHNLDVGKNIFLCIKELIKAHDFINLLSENAKVQNFDDLSSFKKSINQYQDTIRAYLKLLEEKATYRLLWLLVKTCDKEIETNRVDEAIIAAYTSNQNYKAQSMWLDEARNAFSELPNDTVRMVGFSLEKLNLHGDNPCYRQVMGISHSHNLAN